MKTTNYRSTDNRPLKRSKLKLLLIYKDSFICLLQTIYISNLLNAKDSYGKLSYNLFAVLDYV